MNLEAVLQLSLAFTRVMGHEVATSVLISSGEEDIFFLGDIENISLSLSGAVGSTNWWRCAFNCFYCSYLFSFVFSA
jgi:hypothetical protein